MYRATLLFLALSSATHASTSDESDLRGIAATVGASLEAGKMENGGMGLQSRTMTAISLEALPGYRFSRRWLVGLDFDYRFQQQQASLANAGGTNLAGKGWLLGIGAQYHWNPKWAVQAGFDFLGKYSFDRQTANQQDNHLGAPLWLRAKAQRLIADSWSLDAVANYGVWKQFTVQGVDHSESTKQWMIGLGVTYHFDGLTRHQDTEN